MTYTKPLFDKRQSWRRTTTLCRAKEVRDLIHLAYPVDKTEMQHVILQIFAHKALNKVLSSNGLQQHGTFWLSNKSCFDAGLITRSAYNQCLRINQMGNAVKHQSVIVED